MTTSGAVGRTGTERAAVRPSVPPGTRRPDRTGTRLAAAVAAGAVAGLVVLATVDPHEPGRYPTCPFLALTGLYCPGCGSLRALHDLAHLDLAGAWSMNPALVLVAPVLVAWWVAWVRRAATGRPRRLVLPVWCIWTVLGLVVAYWVARNIPVLGPWLAP